MPYLQIRKNKNMLIRVFLHAEFISAMKTVQNPTIFVKNAKKQNNDQFSVIFAFFQVFTETLEQNIRKSHMFFQMEKKTNKEKLEIFKFLRKSALSQGYSL